MKRFLALITVFTLLCTLPFAGVAFADEDPGSSIGDGSNIDGGNIDGGNIDDGNIDDGNDDNTDGGNDNNTDGGNDDNTDDGDEPEMPPYDDSIQPTLTVQAPSKVFYTVGEVIDYAGGAAIFTAQHEFRFNLTDKNCSAVDMSTPGNKTVTVTVHGLKAYFRVVVLSAEEPITAMKDINYKHWSYSYFGPAMKAGYYAGDQNSYLNPDQPITRAEMAQIIYRAWQDDPTVMTESAAGNPFPDVPANEWYYEPIEACRKAGILRGMDTGECRPEDPILRQDAVLMLMRIQYTDAELAAIDIPARIAESGVNPTDFDQVSEYAAPAMAAALGELIKGDQNGAINPGASITRAEVAAIFQRRFLSDYHWEPPIRIPLIYLSPSNQDTNPYAAGNTNECAQMTRLAEAVKVLLEAEGYEVFLADQDTQLLDRCNQANAMGADLYIPIHSNAGGATTGTFVFYNGGIAGCEEFSREIFDRLAALTGTAYSTKRHKEDYLCLMPDGAPFKEVMYPTMPLAYLEVEFHDKADKALWIINNTDKLARAIADGVIAYLED